MEIYDLKFYFIVQSKYPEVLDLFKSTFIPTTSKFKNILLVIEDGKEYGAPVINKHINKCRDGGYNYFAVFNDDIWFAEGWLESIIPYLEEHWVVSPGYVETGNKEKFEKAVELTKNEKGFAKHLYGPNAVFRMDIFKKVGIFDERFDWTCDDLDWAWRLHLNGLSSITLKKITIGHLHGETRVKGIKNWFSIAKINKQRFYDKHGYEGYRHIRSEYKFYHQYFVQFK